MALGNPMRKLDDWYYQNDEDWLSSCPEGPLDDESEDEVRILEWDGDWDWGQLFTIRVCLTCGNALYGNICEVC